MSLLLNVLKQILKEQEKLQSIRKSSAETLKNSLILTLICNERSGYLHVTDAITTLRVKSMESVRFKLLTSMLHSQTSYHFQLLASTDDANTKVYLQHELEQAGFDPDSLDRHSLGQNVEFGELQKELDIWRKNYINVDRDLEELYQQQNRGSMLRDEIDRLQGKLKKAEAAIEKETKLKLSAEARFDKLRENAAEMQDVFGRITDIDDEAKLRDIDFSEFEQIFQLPIKEVESRDRGDRIVQRTANLVTCVDISKARNMIITIKRTGLLHKELRSAIDSFQLDKLPGEYAELLLKYVPTKKELTCLAEHAQHYERMGEAEKYLFQMTKVKRLERKLSLMAFMGKFDDVVKNINPEMELIHKSSELLLNSVKLKKVFELVLAFGNYMNSMKKGYAVGFKLESLSKVREVIRSVAKFVMQRTAPQVSETADRFRKMEETYKNVCTYFGEDYRHMEPDDLVRYVADFVTGFKKGVEENHKSTQTETPSTRLIRRRHESVSGYRDIKIKTKKTPKLANKVKSSSLISRVYTYPQKIDNANDSDSRKQPHITVIKVSKDESFEEMGVGEYSELSLSRVPSMTTNHLEQDPHICHASFAKTGDLKLVKSNSFIYAAKESGYAKIKRSPSVNTYVNNDVRDLAAANRNKAETGIQNSTRQSYIEPVYEDMPMENVSDKESTPALPNGFHKSHSETDSLATNSLSSMSTTPTNTSGSMSMTKVYPVTSVHGDKTDIKQNEKLVLLWLKKMRFPISNYL
ncbi:hypothetical protein LSH36_127g11043 [Paralvinella palmiformis]|uniref:FH2 domain-containing protein n=1 Tax=Paralvinella palmiformis TaxID=53620 RepID=A0AAD9JX75_9ANNE|nr:hypothetical protein LSH36_127g11043 [Paralvinella palmiformis]